MQISMPSLVETSSMVYDQKDICSIRLEMESSLRLTEEFLFASISIYPAAYIYIYPRLASIGKILRKAGVVLLSPIWV